MYFLESERLILHPLSSRYLYWFVDDQDKLEEALNLNKNVLEVAAGDSFLEQYKKKIKYSVIPAVQKNADQYMWYTHWLLILKKEKIIAGGIGIHGEPDLEGAVYLNYFLDKKFERKGLATEAVKYLTGWLINSEKILSVRAITPKDHQKAKNVLLNSSFKINKETADTIEWIFEN
jgi:RimJ/RimL family protein N-acetyltransferase